MWLPVTCRKLCKGPESSHVLWLVVLMVCFLQFSRLSTMSLALAVMMAAPAVVSIHALDAEAERMHIESRHIVGAHLAHVLANVEPLEVTPLSVRDAVVALDARFGVQRAPPAYGALLELDPRLQELVSALASALIVAQDARDKAYAGVEERALLDALETERPEAMALIANVDTMLVKRAALTMAAAVDAQLPALQALALELRPAFAVGAGAGEPPLIDLAPALVMDPLGVNNHHTKDAALVIDLGGDDIYDTNAGGALIHLNLVGDASTCQASALGLSIGCENEDAFQSFSASMLIDVAGDDTYGVYKPPRPGSRDAICSSDPVVRRVVVQGSGSGGIGMLIDVSGADLYRGKTLAQGNGHLGGVGALFDLEGDDAYHAVRSAMGSGVLGGTGIFYEGAGHDTYTFAAPSDRGLFNVDQFRCDTTARLGLGSAVLQSTGHFVDHSGDDTYRVDAQGLGHAQSTSIAQFADLAGNDDYGDYPGRGNNQSTGTVGLFVDRS